MQSQSTYNLEFVLPEHKTPQVLFEILFSSDNDNLTLAITAEGVSTLLFIAYVLSSIYLLYRFQRAIIQHHQILLQGPPTINAIVLFGINHEAIYLHCLWDNLLRYIFNTLLRLPYGTSFFYPAPQSPLEIIPRLMLPHPTSEGLDFWTKLLLIFSSELSGFAIMRYILPWYEVQQERQSISQKPSTNKDFESLAKMENLLNEMYSNKGLGHNTAGGSGHRSLQLEDRRHEGEGVEGAIGGNPTPDSAGYVMATLEDIISETRESHINSVHDLDVLWSLIEGYTWGIEKKRDLEQMLIDASAKEECSILGESVVLVDPNEINAIG